MNIQTGFISYYKLRTQLERSLVQNVYVFVQGDKNMIKMTAYYNLTASFEGEKPTSKSLTSIYFMLNSISNTMLSHTLKHLHSLAQKNPKTYFMF